MINFSYLYSAQLPKHLTSKTELKDLTKLSQRFNIEQIKAFVKFFELDQFDDDDDDVNVEKVKDDSVDTGGFIDRPPSEATEEIVSASATQNLNLLLDALAVGDVTQATQATMTSETVTSVKRDDDDDDWNEMCDFLTQKRLDERASSFNEVRYSSNSIELAFET